jgi:hypothetical protein
MGTGRYGFCLGGTPARHRLAAKILLFLSPVFTFRNTPLHVGRSFHPPLNDPSNKDFEAEKALLRTLELEPANINFLTATAQYYMKRK